MHKELKKLESEGAKLFTMSEDTTVVVHVDEYRDKPYIGVRKFLVTEKFVGFTRQGINIPKELAESVAKAILALDKES